jgi:hypothetical protein
VQPASVTLNQLLNEPDPVSTGEKPLNMLFTLGRMKSRFMGKLSRSNTSA